MNVISLTLTGLNIVILMSVVAWVKSCPFIKVPQPVIDLSDKEMDALYHRLCKNWINVRDMYGPEVARSKELTLDFSIQELKCLKHCLVAVLQECDGNPVELRTRVGEPDAVRRLANQLEAAAE